MFAASTYEEINAWADQFPSKAVIILLFIKPAEHHNQIIREFEYLHYNTKEYCMVFAVGYTDDLHSEERTYYSIGTMCNAEWFFSNKVFVDFKELLESRINWEYSGDVEILILQNKKDRKDPLDFRNYIAVNIDAGLRDGYIDSFPSFMEKIVRNAKKQIKVMDTDNEQRIKLKELVSDTIESCKTVRTPVRKIISDRHFYNTANSYKAVQKRAFSLKNLQK